MNEITFRPAKPKDEKTLFKIKRAAYGDEFKLFNYAEQGYAVDDCFAKKPKDDGMFSLNWHKIFCSEHDGIWSLVIEAKSKIIGQIVACSGQHEYFAKPYSEYDMTGNVNIIFCIYVAPEYKNKGIGKMAIEYMEQLHPADKWILDTPKVSPKNKAFYEKCGYKQGANGSLNVYSKGFGV